MTSAVTSGGTATTIERGSSSSSARRGRRRSRSARRSCAGRRVVEGDVDAERGQRVADARAEQAGADDAHGALHARGATRAREACVESVTRSPGRSANRRRRRGSGASLGRARARVSSAPRSTLVNSRARPAGRVPRCSGPNCRRTSSTTGCPTASIMRRTMRLRPECSVSSTSEPPPSRRAATSSRALSAAIGPSSSSMPRVSVCDRLRGDASLDLRDVDLRDAERRVREHVRELAVVGEHEQAAGLGIQSADVVEALLASPS